jgi:hypothetical protein
MIDLKNAMAMRRPQGGEGETIISDGFAITKLPHGLRFERIGPPDPAVAPRYGAKPPEAADDRRA